MGATAAHGMATPDLRSIPKLRDTTKKEASAAALPPLPDERSRRPRSGRPGRRGFSYFTRSMKVPSRVSRAILVPMSQKSGTETSKPVSRVAGLKVLPEVSPLTPGSQ